MKQRLSRISPVVAALAVVLGLSASSVGAATLPSQTIYMKGGKAGLRFVAPESVVAGTELTVLNQTDPKQIGPHTFSLVTKSSLPKTPKARKLCFAKGHICNAIATWHGVKGEGPVTKNPAKAGLPGWDTEGSVSEKGDSWFTGNKAGTSLTQPVSVDTTGGPTRLHFLCVIHPWMQGSVEVVPPAAPLAG